jgi:hypothetical protein
MAYQDTFNISNVPVTCTGEGSHSWLKANFRIEAAVNTANTGYDVKIYTQMIATEDINWTGDAMLRVNCNGVNSSNKVTLEMRSAGSSVWDGPATFFFNGLGVTRLVLNFDLDLTITTGLVTFKPGIYHRGDGGNLQHFYYNNYVISIGEDGGLPPVISVPTISSLTNTNPFNSNIGISASTNSIGLKWTESGTITNRYYRLNGGSWVSASSSNITITGLTPGTTYNIDVYTTNSGGSSNTISGTVRTRHNAPVVTLTYDSKKLDSLVFKWTSDKPLGSSQIKVNNGSWTNFDTGTSGIITLEQCTPNTEYVVYFKGTSTSTYDSLASGEVNASAYTLDIAKITSIGDCIFGNNISITINNPTTNTAKLKVWTTGNSNKPEFEFKVVNGTNVFAPTQAQLDLMYRCFSTSNSIPIYFSLITEGTWQEWTDTQQNKSLQLTGIAKTAYISVDNIPKRAQAFIGVGNTPKRAIVWIGDENNKPRRCT